MRIPELIAEAVQADEFQRTILSFLTTPLAMISGCVQIMIKNGCYR